MVQTVKTVGEQRYRESFGRHYEDFQSSATSTNTAPAAPSPRPTTPGSRC